MLTLDDLKLKYGFEDYVINALKDRGIERLLPPQEAAIRSGVLEGQSLILSANSSTGKTLIAELAIMKLATSLKTLYLVPLKALAEDKFRELEEYYSKFFSIGISTSDREEHDDRLEELDVLIATYEKAEILTRTNSRWAKSIGLLVVDEFHHIGDENRGPALEFLITRLLQINKNLQLLCLSATVAEPETFQRWLGMNVKVLKFPDYRPVPLRMGVLYDGKITFDDGEVVDTGFTGRLEAMLLQVVTKEVASSKYALVFTHSRYYAEKYAGDLAVKMSQVSPASLNCISDDDLQKFVSEEAVSTDVEPSLVACLRKGVAYHHAGLSDKERTFIEKAFKEKRIAVIFATTTLAEGINFPASLTVFESLRKGSVDLTVNDFRNMAGRAGRVGYVDVGEAIVLAITKRQAYTAMERYIKGPLQVVISQLIYEKELRRNLMVLLSTSQYGSFNEISAFFSQTYYSKSTGSPISKDLLFRLLRELQEAGFVKGTLPTTLGRVCASRRYDPLSIQRIVEGFKLILERGIPITDFTLLHLVCSTSDFENSLCYNMYWEQDRFPSASVERAEEVVQTSYKDYEHLGRVFKTAMMLEAWVNGEDTKKEYNVYPSDAQTNYADCALWLVTTIPDALEAAGLQIGSTLADQVEDLKERLKYGIPKKYLGTARVFSNLGFDPLSRRRLIMLGELHINSVYDLVKIPHVILSKALGSTVLAERVLDVAAKLSNDPKLIERQRLIREAEQIGFQGPVTRLFNATDESDYKEAIFRILRSLTSLIARPSADSSVSPDFVIAKPNGESISVVAKYTGTEITPNDIGDAVTRSLSERSSIVTAIVASKFSSESQPLAHPKTSGSKVTLLTDAALVKILLLSKTVHPEALLLAALEAGGVVFEEDISRLAKSASYAYDPKANISEIAQDEKGPVIPSKNIDGEKLSSAIRGENR
jgi:helicase